MAEITNWDPSVYATAERTRDTIAEVTEPPCRSCLWFTPERLYNADGTFARTRMCSVNRMENDFTCFEAPPDE